MTAALTDARLSFGGVLRSEFLKLTTVRSLWWVGATSIVLGSISVLTTDHGSPDAGVEGQWTAAVIASAIIAAWVILALYAALQATGEWSSGQYRATFAVVPRRTTWLVAKATALAIIAAIIGALVTALAAVIALARYSGDGAVIEWGAGYTWQVLVGVPVVCALTAAMAVGIGVLVRSSGVAVTVVVGLLVLLPIAGLLGLEWLGELTSYLPSGAGDAIVGSGAFGAAADDLGVVLGSIVLLVWSVGACVAAAVALSRRDA